jgi:choline monooxygenase
MTYLISKLNAENNTIIPIPQYNNRVAIQNANNKVSLISNSCLHRGAIMVKEKQKYTGSINCPLHHWAYDIDGKLIGEPIDGAKGCLKTYDVVEWNNLLFKDKAPNIDLPPRLKDYFDMSHYVHTKTETMVVNSSWEVFMEVYLDLYHVKPYHPGLGNFVDMNNYKWHFGDDWSLQEVMLTPNLYENPNLHFLEMQDRIRKDYPDTTHGALWLTIYPNIMIEWYPNTLVVSTIWPGKDSNTSFNVIEYHHLDSVFGFDPEFMMTQFKAYESTALEDAEICERIQQGRNKPATSYLHHPELEKGIGKFYEWYNNNYMSKFFLEAL